ncbi:DUF106 domain-containing protein [Halobium salinum]|uniref:DUF106 domain-containing protein n=1 Tax=Halobium salinum TaxID=1364940 RepID=A0ABD5P9W7_9EURY|nr:DUF106 domain-containing protein [Halobium salinum]
MARTEEKVRSLVSEDSEMRSAVETVLARSEDGEVKWVDVKGDLTSGQWGRLIERGVLVDGDSGFRLADESATRAALNGAGESATASASTTSSSSSTDPDEIEGTTWSIYDKAAALITVSLFAGYSWAPMRNLVGGTFDLLLSPLISTLPFFAVVMVLALATGLYSTLLQANLMNMDKMGAYQERMKDIQERRKDAKERGDDDALDAIQEEQMEAMGDQLGMFKEQFRPMVWIMFLTIPVFLWMYWAVGVGGNAEAHYTLESIVLPLVGERRWLDQAVGPIQVWIVWYFLCSMAFTQIIRKGLNIQTTPSAS